MAEHPIEGLMKTTMDSLKEMVDVNTIVGDPVETKDGNVIIPISKVCIGFASGGSEFNQKEKEEESGGGGKFPFGGGSGADMSIQPVAFLVVGKEQVKLLPVHQSNSLERIIDNVPDLMDEIRKLFKKDKKAEEPEVQVQNNISGE
jgi:sporulation protein YtfJ